MTKMQEQVLTLLREIDAVCRQKGFPYVLFGPSAAYVMENGGSFGEEVSLLQIMMTGADAAKLMKELTKEQSAAAPRVAEGASGGSSYPSEDSLAAAPRVAEDASGGSLCPPDDSLAAAPRAVESLHTNPYLPQNVFRYVDTSTTRIDLATIGGISCPGAAVEIVPMIDGKAGKEFLLLEGGLLYLNGGQELKGEDYRGKLRLSIQVVQGARGILGDARLAERIYRQTCSGSAGKDAGGRLYVRWGGGSMKRISAKFLQNVSYVPLEDLMLPVPAEWEAFTKALEPQGWQENLPGYLAQLSDPDLIEDAEQPYEVTLRQLAESGLEPERLAGERRAYIHEYLTQYLPKEKPVQDHWLSAKRSVERIDLYHALLPMRNELRRAAKDGDLKGMEDILDPYLKAADRWLHRNMGLYLDRETFDYAARIWKKKGSRTKAARILLLTPAAHRKGSLYGEIVPLVRARRDAGTSAAKSTEISTRISAGPSTGTGMGTSTEPCTGPSAGRNEENRTMANQTILHTEGDYTSLLQILKERGVSRLFVVCGKNSGRLPATAYVRALPRTAGIAVEEFSGFEANPKYESVAEGVRRLQAFGADAVLAIGGGSAMDTAKCIKLYSALDPSGNMLEVKEEAALRNDLPLIVLPTTAGTGSEATRFAVIYYEGNKQSIEHETIVPSIVVLDPSVLEGLPPYQRRATMMDALSHALESYWSVYSTEESRGVSADALRSVLRAKDGYLQNTKEGNQAMQLAALRAGQAINLTKTTAGHAMCYKLTSLFGIAHGQACALVNTKLLPYMAAHTADWADARGQAYLEEMFQSLAGVMDCADAAAASARLQAVYDEMEFPAPWKGTLEEDQLQTLVSGVNPERLKNNPVRLDAAAIETLYRAMLS